MKSFLSVLLSNVFLLIVSSTPAVAALPGDVRIEASLTPSVAVPGKEVELAVTIHTQQNWVSFDLEQVPGSVMPTRIDLDRSDDWAPIGTFRSEGARDEYFATFGQRPVRTFDTPPTFRRSIRVSKDATEGDWKITGRCSFMVYARAQNRFFLVSDVPFSAMGKIERTTKAVSTSSVPAEVSESPPPISPVSFAAEELPKRTPPASFSIHVNVDPVKLPEASSVSWLFIGTAIVVAGTAVVIYRWRTS